MADVTLEGFHGGFAAAVLQDQKLILDVKSAWCMLDCTDFTVKALAASC